MTHESGGRTIHDVVRALLPAYIADELTPRDRAGVAAHLQQCDQCYADFDEIRVIMHAFATQYQHSPSNAYSSIADAVMARLSESYGDKPTPESYEPRHGTTRHSPSQSIRSVRELGGEHERLVSRERRGTAAWSPAQQRPKRTGVIAAVVAAVSVAALFALLLHTFVAGNSITHPGPTPTVEPTGTAGTLHYLGPNGTWDIGTSVQVSENNDYSIVVAPSDPHMLYRAPFDVSHAAQRSNDGGKSWADLDVPSGDTNGAYTHRALLISPFDPNFVVATLSSEITTEACPSQSGAAALSNVAYLNPASRQLLDVRAGPLAPPPPGHTCYMTYTSFDGGGTWQQAQVAGQGGITNSHGLGVLIGQGNRLFATLAGPDDSTKLGHRIVSSTDGIHWQYADASIAAKGQVVVEYVATPSSTTLFATTAPASAESTSDNVSATREFWRSDDQGATWHLLGNFPTGILRSFNGTLIGAVTLGNKTYVYETDWSATPVYAAGTVPTVHVTSDDGHTWQVVPTTGQPEGEVIPGNIAGVLPDGTLVAPFAQYTQTTTGDSFTHQAYFGWKPGAATWTQLTPLIPGVTLGYQFVWLSQPGATTPAGIWTEFVDGQNIRLAYCRLTT